MGFNEKLWADTRRNTEDIEEMPLLNGGDLRINFSDSFDRVDSSTLGGQWTDVLGTLGITSNYCVAKTHNNGTSRADLNIGLSDFESTVDLVFESGETPAFLFRTDGTNNNRMMFYVDGTNIYLRKVVGGSSSILSTVAFVPTVGTSYTYKTIANGDNIKVYINNVLYIDFTDVNVLKKYLSVGLQVFKTAALGASKFDNFSINGTNVKMWTDATWVTFGDSITNYGIYQKNVLKNLKFLSFLNKGVSGESMADNSSGTPSGKGTVTTIVETDVTPYRLLTIASGTNDFRYSVALGTLGVIGDTGFNRNTFYGALRHAVEVALIAKPSIKIILVTPTQRNKDSYDVNFVNGAGLKLIDYVNAIVNVGNLYGIPVCDMYRISSFTEKTLALFTVDGLHPTTIGYKRFADVLSRFIYNNGIDEN